MVTILIIIAAYYILKYEIDEKISNPIESDTSSSKRAKATELIEKVDRWANNKKRVRTIAVFLVMFTLVMTMADVARHGSRYNLFQYMLRQTNSIMFNLKSSGSIIGETYCNSIFSKIPKMDAAYEASLSFFPEEDEMEFYQIISSCR